jgi:hypothetical protein
MITLIIFTIHVVAFAGAYTRRWQDGGISEGFLAVFFMTLIFFVGWSMSTFILKLSIEPAGFGPALDRDTLSLLLLTIGESVLYYFYLKSDGPASDSPR